MYKFQDLTPISGQISKLQEFQDNAQACGPPKPVFYAPQLYRQVLLRRVLAMGILSVCLSVCPSVRLSVTTRYQFKAK